jgi:hypothetical protein
MYLDYGRYTFGVATHFNTNLFTTWQWYTQSGKLRGWPQFDKLSRNPQDSRKTILCIQCVFHFSLKYLFETVFGPINIWWITLKMRTETHVDRRLSSCYRQSDGQTVRQADRRNFATYLCERTKKWNKPCTFYYPNVFRSANKTYLLFPVTSKT